MPLTSSLKVAEEVTGNAAVRRDVRRLDTDVRHGARFGRLLGDLPYVPATALQLVQLGDQTGRLGAMLLRAGDLLDDEVQQGLKRFLAIFVPGLTPCLISDAATSLINSFRPDHVNSCQIP